MRMAMRMSMAGAQRIVFGMAILQSMLMAMMRVIAIATVMAMRFAVKGVNATCNADGSGRGDLVGTADRLETERLSMLMSRWLTISHLLCARV